MLARDYALPAWTTPDTTVLCASYSGNTEETLAAYDAAQALTSAGQTTFDAALAAYRSGAGSITDVMVAESQLLQAKNARSDSYSTALSAAATLALATGALGGAPQ